MKVTDWLGKLMLASLLVQAAGATALQSATLPKNPVDAIKSVEAHYQSLSKFETSIVHHDDSGLYPGDYEQVLKWTKPAAFTLAVTKPSSDAKRKAGDFTCDGTTVHVKGDGYADRDRELNKDKNMIPGYEVSGGPILSWLLNSPSADMFVDPKLGMKFAWGADQTWQGVKAKTIEGTFGADAAHLRSIRFYLSEDGNEFIGYSFEEGGKDHFLLYKDQKPTP